MSETSQTHKAEAPKKLNFGVFICSTSRFEELEKGEEPSDASGDLIVSLLKKTGHVVVLREILPDNSVLIGEAMQRVMRSADTDVVIFCGGTGITPSDVTIEAVSPYLQKHLPGFGEIFRRLTYDDIGTPAVLSRACAGIVEGKAVFCIPGSPNAVRTCFEKLILPEVGHIVKHAHERAKQGSDSRKK